MDSDIAKKLTELSIEPKEVGVLIVDHGSRRAESNALLDDVAALFRRITGHSVVHAAHMELAEPSISAAFEECVAEGAQLVVVMPYFLSPGRHWNEDIPRLAAEAASRHPTVRFLVTAPLGLHSAMVEIMSRRIVDCLDNTLGDGEECDICRGTGRCKVQNT